MKEFETKMIPGIEVDGDWRDVPGWLDDENYKMFQTLRLPKKPRIMECGTYHGRSAWMMYELWPQMELHTCDPIDYEQPLPPNTTYYKNHGQQLEWKKKFDMVFIDASHTYDDTKELFDKYSKLIKKNGYIVFHDYHETDKYGAEGVRRFVNELGTCQLFTTGEFGGAIWQKER